MNEEHLCDILIEWIGIAFSQVNEESVTGKPLTAWDPRYIAYVLHDISPDSVFTSVWAESFEDANLESHSQSRKKQFDKILKCISDYYALKFQKKFADHLMPDSEKISDESSSRDLGLLLQLILCCAVQASKQSDYVNCIMKLKNNKQHMIMESIKMIMNPSNQVCIEQKTRDGELQSSTSDSCSSPDLQRSGSHEPTFSGEDVAALEVKLQALTRELNVAVEQRNASEHACEKLDSQLVSLQDDLTLLHSENGDLKNRLTAAESVDYDLLDSQRYHSDKEITDLRLQLETSEIARDDLAVKSEVLNNELTKLQTKILGYIETESLNQEMKDELDVLRQYKIQVKQLERKNAEMKHKLDAFDSTKQFCTQLEAKHNDIIKKNIALLEENKRTEVLKAQLDVCKRQEVEHQVHLSEANLRADAAHMALKREREISAQKELQKFELQLEDDADIHYKVESLCSEMGQVMNESGDSLNASFLPLNVQEKFLRMKTEFTKLKQEQELQIEKSDEVLKMKLDDATTRIQTLENDNKELHMTNIELDQKLGEVKDLLSAQTSNVTSPLAPDLQLKSETNNDTEAKLAACVEELKEKTILLDKTQSKVSSLQSELELSEDKITISENKFQLYITKARKALSFYKNAFTKDDSKLNDSTQIAYLKSTLEQKELEISNYKKEMKCKLDMDYKMTSLFMNQGVQENKEIIKKIVE